MTKVVDCLTVKKLYEYLSNFPLSKKIELSQPITFRRITFKTSSSGEIAQEHSKIPDVHDQTWNNVNFGPFHTSLTVGEVLKELEPGKNRIATVTQDLVLIDINYDSPINIKLVSGRWVDTILNPFKNLPVDFLKTTFKDKYVLGCLWLLDNHPSLSGGEVYIVDDDWYTFDKISQKYPLMIAEKNYRDLFKTHKVENNDGRFINAKVCKVTRDEIECEFLPTPRVERMLKTSSKTSTC